MAAASSSTTASSSDEGCGPGPPSLIMSPWLFIGTETHASDEQLLRSLGVTHVLRCIGGAVRNRPGLTDELIPLCDFGRSSLRRCVEEALPFLDSVFNADKAAVLVHCAAGINRSPAMVVGYLVLSPMFRMTLCDAFKCVAHGRPQTCIHDAYVAQLREMDAEVHGKHSTMPDEIPTTSSTLAGVWEVAPAPT